MVKQLRPAVLLAEAFQELKVENLEDLPKVNELLKGME